MLSTLRQPVAIALGGAGIFNLLSIAYAFPPRLRVRLTQGSRALPWKPWVFGEGDFRPLYRLLMPCIITSSLSSAPYGTPSAKLLRSPTAHIHHMHPRFRLYAFSPGYYRRGVSRLVSCYALFK